MPTSSYVQDIGTGTSTTSTTFNISVTSAPAATSSLLLELGWNGTGTVASPGGVTDTAGNLWTLVVSKVSTSTIETAQQWITLQNAATLTTSDTITVTYTIGTTTVKVAQVRELSGKILADQTGSNQTGAVSATTFTVSTTSATIQAASLVWASCVTGALQTSWTKDAAYTLPTSSLKSLTSRSLLSEYLPATTAGVQTATGSAFTSSTNYAAVIANYYVPDRPLPTFNPVPFMPNPARL